MAIRLKQKTFHIFMECYSLHLHHMLDTWKAELNAPVHITSYTWSSSLVSNKIKIKDIFWQQLRHSRRLICTWLSFDLKQIETNHDDSVLLLSLLYVILLFEKFKGKKQVRFVEKGNTYDSQKCEICIRTDISIWRHKISILIQRFFNRYLNIF